MYVWRCLLTLLAGIPFISLASAEATYKCIAPSGRTTFTNQKFSSNCVCIEGDECPAICDGDKCTITISKQKDGHFYIVGLINNQKVRFLIDTGATISTISQKTANALGIHGSKSAISETAGGKVTVSIAENIPIVIAGLPPIKINVSVSPSLDGDIALLGQNYLQRFKVAIEGRSMMLSAAALSQLRH
jgi:clan AA aspartic protease (TIGR02281 family)